MVNKVSQNCAYFDEDAIPDAQPDQDHYLETIALRASELSEEGIRALLGMLDHISKLEGAKNHGIKLEG